MKTMIARLLLAVALVAAALPAVAQNILTARSSQNFERSMLRLKASIESHGYTVSHVQRCDSGLTGLGYETDGYRVVFFGKLDEIRRLSAAHPALTPFLPLKISIFAEGDESIVSSINPAALGAFYRDEELQLQFSRWENDLRSILGELRSGAETAD